MRFLIFYIIGFHFMASCLEAAVVVKKISRGSRLNCAMLEISGGGQQKRLEARCWGRNDFFETEAELRGKEGKVRSPAEDSVMRPLPWMGSEVLDFAVSGQSLCAIRKDFTVGCVGFNYTSSIRSHSGWSELEIQSRSPIQIDLQSDIPVSLHSGVGDGFCVTTKSDRLHCWRAEDVVPWTRLKLFQQGSSWLLEKHNWSPHTTVYRLGSPVKMLSMSSVDQFCAQLENNQVKCFRPGNLFGMAWGRTDSDNFDSLAQEFARLFHPEVGTSGRETDDWDLSANVFSLSFGKLSRGVFNTGLHACVSLEDGTLTCWGGQEGLRDLPQAPWFSYEKEPYVAGFSHVRKDWERKDYACNSIRSQNHQVVSAFAADRSSLCFVLHPPSEKSHSNLKCLDTQRLNLTVAQRSDPHWIDNLPWVELGAPIHSLYWNHERFEEDPKRICALFQNGGVKCGIALQRNDRTKQGADLFAIDDPATPYLEFELEPKGN